MRRLITLIFAAGFSYVVGYAAAMILCLMFTRKLGSIHVSSSVAIGITLAVATFLWVDRMLPLKSRAIDIKDESDSTPQNDVSQ
ncbi:MAG: hypothetical protein KDA92_07975 [Planctomycetales bacterium]|nr:hypothetical protein [Planctomycetales bacterium]